MNQSPIVIPSSGGKSSPPAKRANVLVQTSDAAATGSVETGFETPKRIGLIIAFLVFGVFGLWAAFAPLEGYAPAPGIVVVRSNKQVVQHWEGGIVKDILVQNGDVVKAGDVLLELDPTQSVAQLEIYNGQMMGLMALEARLLAERGNLDAIVWPDDLPAEGLGLNERRSQEQVFAARRQSREGEIAVLQQRIEQLESQVVGLKAVQESKTMLAASYADELTDVRALLKDGFENKLRLRDLERSYAEAMGQAAELAANIASTEIKIGETRLGILQLENDIQREVADQLADTQTQLQNTRERVLALRDIVARNDIRAPVDGVVNGLQVHTIGGVIAPGSLIADIVPQTDELVIEGRVQITDIDRVAEGQAAMVRLSAFNSKNVPTLYGKVLTLSADSMIDQMTGAPYYSARIQLTPESLAALEGLELKPGMPAEAFIATGSRTFLEYLMKPLTNSIARTFNED